MTQGRLLEIARLRGLISRLKRQYGDEATLSMLHDVIVAELSSPKPKAKLLEKPD